MALAAIGDSSVAPVSTSTADPTPAAPPASASAPPKLTETQILDEFNQLKNADEVYARARQLAEQAQNDAAEEKAIEDAFNARIVAPAAKSVADAYTNGGAMAAAASLHNALKGAPAEVAESIFAAAKPTVDAISRELGGTAFASKSLLPQTTSGYVAEVRQRKQEGIPQAYPPNLWRIASQDEFKSVYADLSAAVELASQGPNAGAAARQVADDIVTALPYQSKDSVYLPSLEDVDSNALVSSAVTNAVSNGDGAALSLALVKRASQAPAPSNTNNVVGMPPPPKLETNRLFDAIAAGAKTLQTKNDKALTDFTTPAPELAQLVMRYGALAGDDPAGLAKVQDALEKTIDQTPSLKKPLEAKQAAADQAAADVTNLLLDIRAAGPDLQSVGGYDSLSGAATSVQQDKQTSASIAVSATAQSAITDAEMKLAAQQNPTFKAPGTPPNLLWASRIARGIVAEIAGLKISAKPGEQLNAAFANISRMPEADRQQLFGTSDMGAIQKMLTSADPSAQAKAIADAEKAMNDGDLKPIKARAGFAPATPAGRAMTGLGTGLYLLGAWDLLKTPIVKGQNPVPALLNRSFGAYILWGAANNGYLTASSFAQSLLVGENSRYFSNKMPVGGWLDRLTRPAVGKGTIFDYSGELFEGGASVLLAGIAGYEFVHKNYFLGGAYMTASVAGAYPLAVKYGPKIPLWLAGGADEAAGAGALEESLAGGATVGSASEWTGPISAVAVLATTLGIFAYKKITGAQEAAKMEPFNRTFLHNLGYTTGQAKLLANDDYAGNSIGPTLQAVAHRLGITPGQMGQYLASFKDMDKLNQLVLATQNVDADAKGQYRLTLLDHDDAIPDAPAGLSPKALRSFYMDKTQLYDVPTVLQPADSEDAQPPLNADDGYYRKVALKRETPHSIDGLIQWAKDDGIPFPTADANGGKPAPAPVPTPGSTATSTPSPAPTSGPGPTPSPGPAPTPTPTPTGGPTSPPDKPEPHGPGGKPHTPVPTPSERDVTVQPGDTMTGIAQSDGVTLPDLAPLNPTFDWALLGIEAPIQGPRDPNRLFPGDIIHVPIRP
jgi:hypothetical protein